MHSTVTPSFPARSLCRGFTIIELLVARGQLTATHICAQFDVSAPAISQHLKVLREANLVTMTKRGQQRLYAFNPQAVNEMEVWLHRLTRRLGELVKLEVTATLEDPAEAEEERARAVEDAVVRRLLVAGVHEVDRV